MADSDQIIWVLLGRRTGDNKQMLALAQATGLPFVAKQLDFSKSPAGKLPNLVLGGTRRTLTARARDLLSPPWPALVISSGRRAVPAARWIRQQSGNRAGLVHVGRPWAPLSWFDLVVTTPQYLLPERANVLTNLLPLTAPGASTAAPADWLASLPEPRLGVLVGGNSRPLVLTAGTAARLAEKALAEVRANGGSLVVATSPRTPADVVKTLREAIAAAPEVPAVIHEWQQSPPETYRQLLAGANRLIVTGDSAAMVADAVLAGAPAEIFEVDYRPDLRARMAAWLLRLAERNNAARRTTDWLIEIGLLSSVRDLPRLGRRLAEAGLMDGGSPAIDHGRQELERAADRVRRLLRHG